MSLVFYCTTRADYIIRTSVSDWRKICLIRFIFRNKNDGCLLPYLYHTPWDYKSDFIIFLIRYSISDLITQARNSEEKISYLPWIHKRVLASWYISQNKFYSFKLFSDLFALSTYFTRIQWTLKNEITESIKAFIHNSCVLLEKKLVESRYIHFLFKSLCFHWNI